MKSHDSEVLTMYMNQPEDYYLKQLSSPGFRGRWFRKRQSTAYELVKKYWAGGTVLDIGCGNCLWNQNGFPTVGIDINTAMLKYNERRLNAFSPINANIAAGLPIKSDSIDTVVMTEVLEHFEEYSFFIDEVFRVLKPGGSVIVSVPYGKLPGLWNLVFPLWCKYKWLSEHDTYYRNRCGHVADFNVSSLRRAFGKFTCLESLSINRFTIFLAAKKKNEPI